MLPKHNVCRHGFRSCNAVSACLSCTSAAHARQIQPLRQGRSLLPCPATPLPKSASSLDLRDIRARKVLRQGARHSRRLLRGHRLVRRRQVGRHGWLDVQLEALPRDLLHALSRTQRLTTSAASARALRKPRRKSWEAQGQMAATESSTAGTRHLQNVNAAASGGATLRRGDVNNSSNRLEYCKV